MGQLDVSTQGKLDQIEHTILNTSLWKFQIKIEEKDLLNPSRGVSVMLYCDLVDQILSKLKLMSYKSSENRLRADSLLNVILIPYSILNEQGNSEYRHLVNMKSQHILSSTC